MKNLIDYVKAIEGMGSPYAIVKSVSQQETEHDATGSTIERDKQVYYLDDGVSVEYEREYDDGGAYPGCKEFWYTYRVVDANGFKFDGETSKVFGSSSDVRSWLEVC